MKHPALHRESGVGLFYVWTFTTPHLTPANPTTGLLRRLTPINATSRRYAPA